MPMMGSQSIGDPLTSIKRGRPRTAPPNPSPVLTNPIQTKMREINAISVVVSTIISNDALWHKIL